MRLALLLVAALLAGCAGSPAGPPPLPDAVAVLGDSISRAANMDGDNVGDRPQASWATGADPSDGVSSHLERLRERQPGVEVVGFNDARSGAKMAELQRQAEEAVRQRAPYVVILMGANDACAPSVDQMTSAATYRAQLEAAADVLEGLPDGAVVYAVSVPDLARLAETFERNETVRAVWHAFGMCPSALGPDGDPAAVRARIVAYNEALAEVADARGWRWDDGVVFRFEFAASEVSPLDYFHPSLEGQARLAHVTWQAGPYAGLID